MNFEVSSNKLESDDINNDTYKSPGKMEFNKTLAKNLSIETDDNERVLAFKEKAPESQSIFSSVNRVLYTDNKFKDTINIKTRDIPSSCDKTLDAPDIKDDYYLNLMDWSNNNILAIALSQSLYLYDVSTGATEELYTCPNSSEEICSVSWCPDSNNIAFGTTLNQVHIWDITKKQSLRIFKSHASRVGSLCWNNYILSSGSRDGLIINHDVRIKEHEIAFLESHEQEVCGLKWSPDGSYLASGANDNTVCIWDGSLTGHITPKSIYSEHLAAVKALAWSPHQRNILATGGGSSDKTIKLWNVNNNSLLNSVDTGSQVSGLIWNPFEKEILSAHGYRQNQLCLWSYPSMNKMKELNGHNKRILSMCLSPDGQTVCTASADETIKFWRIFEGCKSKISRSHSIKTKSLCLR